MIEVKYKRAEVQKNRIIIPKKYVTKFDRYLKMEIDYGNGEIIMRPEKKGSKK
jgi:hypothetical protein